MRPKIVRLWLLLNFNLLLLAAAGWLFLPGGPAPLVPQPGKINVLIVEETSERNKLTEAQQDVLESTGPGSVREYLATHCAKDAAGNPEFRIVDKDNPMDRDDPKWAEAMKLERHGLPWLYVFLDKDGKKTGFSGPVDEHSLEVLKRWGGP